MNTQIFTEPIKNKITTQDYSPAKKIDGIRLVDLKLFHDDGGLFTELQRLNDDKTFRDFPELDIRQLNYSEMAAGVVKAWHVHPEQDEVWFIPPSSKFLVGLADVRAGSSSEGTTMRFVMGAGRGQLLFIPHGVAHGLTNIKNDTSSLVYFVSKQFEVESEKNQEYRLPWDQFGTDFWEVKKG